MSESSRSLATPTPAPATSFPVASNPGTSDRLGRVAFSIQETAEMLGVSERTVHRLVRRGLLRSSRALRHHLVPRSEIDRFLRETL